MSSSLDRFRALGPTRYTGSEADVVWHDDVDSSRPRGRPLPPDVVRAIRATAARLDQLDAHALIGVEEDADWADIEHAYRRRLAIFHPNGWSEHELEDLRPSMETITDRISLAFALLAEEAAEVAGSRVEEKSKRSDRGEPATKPAELHGLDLELSGERPTYPNGCR